MFYILSNDRAKIAVYDINPEGRKTIVLVHGWPLSHRMFEYQLPALLEKNYRIVSLDLRGFGESEQTGGGYNYDQFATDLYCVIYQLQLTDFILVGFSMGGAIVTKYMGLYQGYGVQKLCLWDAAVPSYCIGRNNPYGQTKEDTQKLIELGYTDRPALNQYFGGIFFAKRQTEAFMNWLQNISNRASGIGEMEMLKALRDEDVFEQMRSIYVPTGIFHGRQDKICSFEMAKIMQKYIPNAQLFPFENAGHGAFYEAKEIFTKTFINFIEDRR